MPFLTYEEEREIIDNKHCSKCGNAAFQNCGVRTYDAFSCRKREIDFECQTCGHVVRYIRSRPFTSFEIAEKEAQRKKTELSFVDRVIAKFKELMR